MILKILASEKMKNHFLKNSPGFTKGSRVRKMCPKCISLGTPERPRGIIYLFLSKFWICGMIYGGSPALTGQLFDGVLKFWI